MTKSAQSETWLTRTVLGVGLTSLFSDWSHEIATAVLPAFLAAIGAGPAWLGAIEGIADGLSSFTKLGAGHYTDQLKRRKPLAVFGYAFTALATASFAFATQAYHVLLGRAAAWLGRGVRSPAKKALLAADVPPWAYGRAFGLERLMDTIGAIVGPLTALWLLEVTNHNYRAVFLWTLLPGMIAVASFWVLVRERPIEARKKQSFVTGLRALPGSFRRFSVGRRRIRLRRFFAHAADSLCHTHACSRAGYGTRGKLRRGPVYVAQRFLRRFRLSEWLDQRSRAASQSRSGCGLRSRWSHRHSTDDVGAPSVAPRGDLHSRGPLCRAPRKRWKILSRRN